MAPFHAMAKSKQIAQEKILMSAMLVQKQAHLIVK